MPNPDILNINGEVYVRKGKLDGEIITDAQVLSFLKVADESTFVEILEKAARERLDNLGYKDIDDFICGNVSSELEKILPIYLILKQ